MVQECRYARTESRSGCSLSLTGEELALADFRLLVNLGNRIVQDGQVCLNVALREHGVSSSEANVLMFLYASGDGVTQDTIVSGVDVSKAAISRTLGSMERKSLIVRSKNESDRRSYRIWLTDKARRLRDYIEAQYKELVIAAAEGISKGAVEEFTRVLQRVAENLESYRKQRISLATPRSDHICKAPKLSPR